MIDGAVRWARPDDDAALRRLCLRTPMVGPVSYCLEREPEFFALTRLQGEAGGRVAVIANGNEIVAMATMAPHTTWIGGKPERVAYLGDLKVDPDRRQAGLAGRIVRFLAKELDRAQIARSYFLVLAGNPAFARLGSSSRHFRKLRPLRNFIVPFGSRRGVQSDIFVTRATADAVPKMVALWNQLNRRRTFAPVLDETLFARWVGGPMAMTDFRLAWHDGDLVGFCAAWDAHAIKQIRLLRLSTGLRLLTTMHNVGASLRRRQRFPSANELLRFLYISNVCADTPETLRSLLEAIHDEHRDDGYLYFDLALDRGDPLSRALERFRSMKVEFEIWQAHAATDQAAIPDDYAYFDISLV